MASAPLYAFKAALRNAGMEIDLADRWGMVSKWIIRGDRTFTTCITIDGEAGFELFLASNTLHIAVDVADIKALVS